MGESARVIAMAMRNRRKVELPEVDSQCVGVLSKDSGIVAGIKEDPLPMKLDQRSEAPMLGQSRVLAEGVVEYGYPVVHIVMVPKKNPA